MNNTIVRIKDFIINRPLVSGMIFIAFLYLRILIGRSYTHWDTFDLITVNFTYLSDSLRHGALPLFNPFSLSGHPTLANLFTNSLYSPIDLVLLVLSVVISPLFLSELNVLFAISLFFVGIFKVHQKLKFDIKTSFLFSCVQVALTTPIIVGQVGFLYSFALLFWGICFVTDVGKNWKQTFLRSLFLMAILVKGYFYFIILFMVVILILSLLPFFKRPGKEQILAWFKEKFILFFLPTLLFTILNIEGALIFIAQYSDLQGDLTIVEPRLRQLNSNAHYFTSLSSIYKQLFSFHELRWNRIGFGVFGPFILLLWGALLFNLKSNKKYIFIFTFTFLIFIFLSSSEKLNYVITTSIPALSSFRWNFYHLSLSIISGTFLAAFGFDVMREKLASYEKIKSVFIGAFIVTLIGFTLFTGVKNSSTGGRVRVFKMDKKIKNRLSTPFRHNTNKRILLNEEEFVYNDYQWIENRTPISHGYNNTVSEFYWRMKDMPFNSKIVQFSCNNKGWIDKDRSAFLSDDKYAEFLMQQIDLEGKSFVVKGSEQSNCQQQSQQGIEPKSIELTPNRLEFEIEISEPGIIAITLQNYPGWSAKVNGKETPLLEVNRVFQGVKVDSAGKYKVVLSYWPKTATALLIFYILLLFAWIVIIYCKIRELKHAKRS